jgi:hypothetical protein
MLQHKNGGAQQPETGKNRVDVNLSAEWNASVRSFLRARATSCCHSARMRRTPAVTCSEDKVAPAMFLMSVRKRSAPVIAAPRTAPASASCEFLRRGFRDIRVSPPAAARPRVDAHRVGDEILAPNYFIDEYVTQHFGRRVSRPRRAARHAALAGPPWRCRVVPPSAPGFSGANSEACGNIARCADSALR